MIKITPLKGFEYEKLDYNSYTATLKNKKYQSTVHGYDIYSQEVGDSKRPTIFIQSGIHGDEWQNLYFCREFFHALMGEADYGHSEKFARLAEKFHWYHLAGINPTGYTNHTRNNINNVDLNRDYDPWLGFGQHFTQAETQLSRDLYIQHKPIIGIDCHTWDPGASGVDLGGYAHVDSYYPNIYKKPRQYDVMYWDMLQDSVRLSLKQNDGFPPEMQVILVVGQNVNSSARAFFASQTSSANTPSMSYTFEIDDGHTLYNISSIGLTLLLIIGLYMENWWENRTLKLTQ